MTEYRRTPWAQPAFVGAKVIKVEQFTFDQVLAARGVPCEFDLLVIDVEGHEQEVFAGFDLDSWRPQMMIVELADIHPDLDTTRSSDAALRGTIQDAGYDIVYKDFVNTIFVSHDKAVAAFQ